MFLTKKDIDTYLYTISRSKRTTMINTESILNLSIIVVVPSRYVHKVYRELNNELPVGIYIRVVSDKIAYKKGLYK